MSDLSQLEEGKLAPADFITKASADIKKDAALFQALPGVKTLETWAVSALGVYLATKLSPTVSTLIVTGIEELVGLEPAAAPGTPTTA